jgi:hypothetical protein
MNASLLAAAKPGLAALVLLFPTSMAWPQDVAPKANLSSLPAGPEARSNDLQVRVTFTPTTSRFGLICNKLADPRNNAERKKLTRDINGMSNNTAMRIDGYEYLFGHETAAARWYRDKGKLIKEAPIPGVPLDRGWRSAMNFEPHTISVTQYVNLVVNAQTLLHDTALVTYLIKNESKTATRTVGLRFMLDTFVGTVDGVPIGVPSHGEPVRPPFLIGDLQEFADKTIPDYLLTVESADLVKPGEVVSVLRPRLRGVEVPEKIVVCRWPAEHGSSEARWKWPYQAIQANPRAPDSCVILYWAEQTMQPGETRRVGFTYGLGRLTDPDSKEETIAVKGADQLRLFAPAVRVGKPSSVTAYVKGGKGEMATLTLPEGVEFAPGQAASEPVPAAKSAYAPICWQVVVKKPGQRLLRATVPSIGEAKLQINAFSDGLD